MKNNKLRNITKTLIKDRFQYILNVYFPQYIHQIMNIRLRHLMELFEPSLHSSLYKLSKIDQNYVISYLSLELFDNSIFF